MLTLEGVKPCNISCAQYHVYPGTPAAGVLLTSVHVLSLYLVWQGMQKLERTRKSNSSLQVPSAATWVLCSCSCPSMVTRRPNPSLQ